MATGILILVVGLWAGQAQARGGFDRVMSINECADQLVLALLPASRIASVTWLSRDPAQSLLWQAARQVKANHGTAEDVLRDRPDVVVSEPGTMPATVALLRRLGFPLIELSDAQSWDDIRAETRRLGAALGVPDRAQSLIAEMDHRLGGLAADAPRPRVVAWDGAGFAARPGTLYDALLRAAGAVNLAAQPPGVSYARPDAEMLLALAPGLLIEAEDGVAQPSLRDNLLHHPLVERLWRGRIVRLPSAYYACGTPYSAAGVRVLREDFARQAARPHAGTARP